MANTADETRHSDSLVGRATAHVEDAASAAQDTAVELERRGKGRLGDELDRRTTEAGSQARSMAGALRQSGEQLRSQGDGRMAGVAEGAADRVERLGSYLEQADGDRLLHDVEDFARRRPWLVAGAGLVAGLVASRFLKASSERRYEGSGSRSSFGGSGYRPGGEQWTGVPGSVPREPLAREGYGAAGR
jgi:hypothetical protein